MSQGTNCRLQRVLWKSSWEMSFLASVVAHRDRFWAALIIYAKLGVTTLLTPADYQLPEPTDVTYRWDDQFQVTVSWSWKKPDNLPKNCTVKYAVSRYELPQSVEVILNWKPAVRQADIRFVKQSFNLYLVLVLINNCFFSMCNDSFQIYKEYPLDLSGIFFMYHRPTIIKPMAN